MRKLWSYFHFTGSGNRSVPVTKPGTGTSSSDRAWYRFQTGDRAWYRSRYRISLVVSLSVPVPVRNSVPVGSKTASTL